MRRLFLSAAAVTVIGCNAYADPASAPASADSIFVSVGRTALVSGAPSGAQAVLDNPSVAEVRYSSSGNLIVAGKHVGSTGIKLYGPGNALVAQSQIVVGIDLPALRQAIKAALPAENIGVAASGAGLVLSGTVTSKENADKAMQIAGNALRQASPGEMPAVTSNMQMKNAAPSGKQVVLHVRVGEISRDALGGLNAQLASRPVADLLQGLEKQGQFRSLVEPNLNANSDEETGFTAGGTLMLPSGQAGAGAVAMKEAPFDITVKFTPQVVGDRIRLTVQPEVPEIAQGAGGAPVLQKRSSKTEVTLASGESFVLGGLMHDQTRDYVERLPGAREMPVLGQLFRSQDFRDNHSDLVVTVTPYIVNPEETAAAAPTDAAPRQEGPMEKFFVKAMAPQGQTPVAGLEGPIGFMTD